MSQIVLGIDPGLNNTGWSVITLSSQNRLKILEYGVIKNKISDKVEKKLYNIFKNLTDIITQTTPNSIAIEEIFVNKNPVSSLKLGQARGIAILTSGINNIPLHEYKATTIKKTVTSNGHATKEQIRYTVHKIFPIIQTNIADITDAIAVSLCHIYHAPLQQTINQ